MVYLYKRMSRGRKNPPRSIVHTPCLYVTVSIMETNMLGHYIYIIHVYIYTYMYGASEEKVRAKRTIRHADNDLVNYVFTSIITVYNLLLTVLKTFKNARVCPWAMTDELRVSVSKTVL